MTFKQYVPYNEVEPADHTRFEIAMNHAFRNEMIQLKDKAHPPQIDNSTEYSFKIYDINDAQVTLTKHHHHALLTICGSEDNIKSAESELETRLKIKLHEIKNGN